MMLMMAARGGKGKKGGGTNDPNMRILYRQPYPGVPVVETYQNRHEGDVLLGYIVEVRRSSFKPVPAVPDHHMPGWLSHGLQREQDPAASSLRGLRPVAHRVAHRCAGRHKSDPAVLCSAAQGPLPQSGQKQRTGPLRQVIGMAVHKASGASKVRATLYRARAS